MPKSSTNRAMLVISLCAAFLFYKYILQNFPSVMAPQLMEAFNLQGLGLGVLSGVYFWTYLIIPLFVGIILDHYGTRWVTAGAILCCAIGVYIFAKAESLNPAIFARALIGVGVSFATVAYLKLAATWFKAKYYALLTSLLVASGMAGAVFGQMPLAWLVHHAGWRDSLVDAGWVGFILAILFVLFVRDRSSDTDIHSTEISSQTKRQLWHDILSILKNKQNWLLTGYSGLAFSPVVIFCGLWGNPFLQKAYGLDQLIAPSLISLVFVGLGVASPLFAIIEKKVSSRRDLMFYCTLASAASISLVLYAHPMPLWLLGSLLFLFGFSLGAFPLVFVIGKEANPIYIAGTVISFINSSDALLDAVTEPLIGKILDSMSSMQGDTQVFSLIGYHVALLILPVYQVIGAFLLRWVDKK